MTLHVCILGIDGSGKSTVTTALPCILAAELKVRAGSAGDDFQMMEADEDLLAPNLHPRSLPVAGYLSKWFKRRAKQFVDNRRLYPFFKLNQMMFQDSAAYKLGLRYNPKVIVSDGNLLLSTMGRAMNYSSPASDGSKTPEQAPDASALKAALDYLAGGEPATKTSQVKLSLLKKARSLLRIARGMGLRTGWLPDVVVFLDVPPETAMARITARGRKIDRHENINDLTQARNMYLKTLDAFGLYRSTDMVHRVSVGHLGVGETLREVFSVLSPHISSHSEKRIEQKTPLGTTPSKLVGPALWAKLFNYRYIVNYLMMNWFKGAWREPTFLLSKLGRLLLSEGYSAGVMRVIYDQDDKRYRFLDRIFLEYPLHRAVYDRLGNLTRAIQPELQKRLATGRDVRIFTAPSGFSYDLFRPLEVIASREPQAMQYFRLVAADLDPHGYLEKEISARAKNLGIRLDFLTGDITAPQMREKIAQTAPYDIILFVGLSGWLPKPDIVSHLKWLCQNIQGDGVLITDCFTPTFYALSGRYFGYKASYYSPELYQALLDYCGFDGSAAQVKSGRDKLNYVVLCSPRKSSA